MTKDRFKELLENESIGITWEGDNAYQGLQILAKYTTNLICGASHDTIYGEGIDKLIAAGITEEDVMELSRLNWCSEDDYLKCFV